MDGDFGCSRSGERPSLSGPAPSTGLVNHLFEFTNSRKSVVLRISPLSYLRKLYRHGTVYRRKFPLISVGTVIRWCLVCFHFVLNEWNFACFRFFGAFFRPECMEPVVNEVSGGTWWNNRLYSFSDQDSSTHEGGEGESCKQMSSMNLCRKSAYVMPVTFIANKTTYQLILRFIHSSVNVYYLISRSVAGKFEFAR